MKWVVMGILALGTLLFASLGACSGAAIALSWGGREPSDSAIILMASFLLLIWLVAFFFCGRKLVRTWRDRDQ